MTKYSYSRVDTYCQCPYKYKLRYIDKLKTLPNYDATNPLILGTALHKGLETNVETAVKEYLSYFPIITDEQIHEVIKLEILIPKAKAMLPDGESEVKIDCENFVGYIDLLCDSDDKISKDIYDYKYTSNTNRYSDSRQLHLYKYYRKDAKRLYYLFIPKINIRQKKTETLHEFRQRLRAECEKAIIKKEEMTYDPNKVREFFDDIAKIESAKEYPKNETKLCDYCEYKELCKEGVDYEIV